MSAKANDDLRMAEIAEICNEIEARLEEFNPTLETFLDPKDVFERTVVDGFYACIYRVIEEASNLDIETMAEFPNIPWNQIRGLRNRVAHAYGELDAATMWTVVSKDVKSLSDMASAYLRRKESSRRTATEKSPNLALKNARALASAPSPSRAPTRNEKAR